MSEFIAVVFGLFIMMALGHGAWVICAMVVRAMIGGADDDVATLLGRRRPQEPVQRDPLVDFRVVVRRLEWKGVLQQGEGDQWIRLAEDHFPDPMPYLVPDRDASPEEASPEQAEEFESELDAIDAGGIDSEASYDPQPHDAVRDTSGTGQDDEAPSSAQPNESGIFVGQVVDDAVTSPTSVATSDRTTTLSQSVSRFMATRNIRWGELVAGAMIVVCSIGLVVSLWHTLTATHRVVPSLIFMAANASIFAAGFYTFSRWRVQATSRAILVIASLLVPLSVLAGLAATGEYGTGVSLVDPVTLATVVAGACVYGWLLLRACKVLFGSKLGVPASLSLWGPTLMIPLVPTVASTLVPQGLAVFVGVVSSAVAAAWMWEPWVRRVQPKSNDPQRGLRPRMFSRRLVAIGLGVFGLACLVTYLVVVILNGPTDSVTAKTLVWLALATIPAWLSMASVIHFHARRSRRIPLCMIADTIIGIACLVVAVMFVPAFSGVGLIWTWAIVLAGTAAVLAWIMNLRSMAIVTLASLWIASVTTSTAWLGISDFQSVARWQCFISGPAVWVTGLWVVGLAVCDALTNQKWTDWIRPVRIVSQIATCVIGVVMFVGPSDWHLGISASSIAMILAMTAVVSPLERRPLGLTLVAPITATVALAFPIVTRMPDWLVTLDAIISTRGLFGWAGIFSGVAVWQTLRSLPVRRLSVTSATIRIHRAPAQSIWIYWTVASTLLCLATLVWLARMLVGLGHPTFGSDVIVLTLFGAAIWTMHLAGTVAWQTLARRTSDGWGTLSCALVAVMTVWASVAIALSVRHAPDHQWMLAGSTSLLISGAIAWLFRSQSKVASSVVVAAFGVLALTAPLLWMQGWWEPWTAGYPVDRLTVVILTVWLMATAVVGGTWATLQRSVNGLTTTLLIPPVTLGLALPCFGISDAMTLSLWVALAAMGWLFVLVLGWPRCKRSLQRVGPSGASKVVDVSVASAVSVLWISVWGLAVFVAGAALVMMLGGHPSDGFDSAVAVMVTLAVAACWSFGDRFIRWFGIHRHCVRGIALKMDPLPMHWGTLPWPLMLTGIAAVCVAGATNAGWVISEATVMIWAMILLVAGAGSLGRVVWNRRQDPSSKLIDLLHAIVLSVGVFVVSVFSDPGIQTQSFENIRAAIELSALILGGLTVTTIGRDPSMNRTVVALGRVLGWLVVFAGLPFLAIRLGNTVTPTETVATWVSWLSTWLVFWRLAAADRPDEAWRFGGVPDAAPWIGLIGSLGFYSLLGAQDQVRWPANIFADVLVLGSVVSVLATAGRRARRRATSLLWVGLLAASAFSAAVRITLSLEIPMSRGWPIALFATTATITVWTFIAGNTVSVLRSLAGGSPITLHRFLRAFCVVALLLAVAGMGTAMVGIDASDDFAAMMGIGVIAMVVIGQFELAEWARTAWPGASERLRDLGMGLLIVALGTFAWLQAADQPWPALQFVMRLFLAMVLATFMIGWWLPWILGQRMAGYWQATLRRGSIWTLGIALASLVGMLIMELMIHESGVGIATLDDALIMLVAAVLGLFSVALAVTSVASGVSGRWSERLHLSNGWRRLCIDATQLLALATWGHLYLCRSDWAVLGLRPYWPWIVMLLAFVSVGLTEWANRRGDRVLASELRRTALFLPLIPLVGFWLSFNRPGSQLLGQADSWLLGQTGVSYQYILAIASAFYIAVSILWKQRSSRIVGIVMGNLALWVWLIQVPGWGFLQHPQAWLIPPAVCVLVVNQLYRKHSDPTTSAAIRSTAILVIYLSSTADMLFAGIGETLAGPIVLILLALAGMLLGAALRWRSFLVLGFIFVLVALISMVYHAGQALDAVWPWWAFGITTGVALLTGLALLEKNRSAMQSVTQRFKAWET
ncbi:hypothetical protein [Crateriforma conspicua]|uniref:Uncharacterized protein n=1 Tax=Crateriforma conspicua TaxID=2527996 RepID=A0A5C6FW40_9PLAN|nr:hypothetical protein [Crateriforma conspicua]TWU65630.1 hypothetical protein V7x_11780 [Crateriforma conspicua]